MTQFVFSLCFLSHILKILTLIEGFEFEWLKQGLFEAFLSRLSKLRHYSSSFYTRRKNNVAVSYLEHVHSGFLFKLVTFCIVHFGIDPFNFPVRHCLMSTIYYKNAPNPQRNNDSDLSRSHKRFSFLRILIYPRFVFVCFLDSFSTSGEHRVPRWINVQLGSTAEHRSLAHENPGSWWTQTEEQI